MKKYILISIAFLAGFSAKAQTLSVLKRDGYELTFFNQDKTLDTALQTRMINTFFKVYPELATEYNPRTLKEVMITIDTAYKGVAATDNGKVTISSAWMHKHPEDIDVITHEVMHIVQDYGDSVGPGWLTEGIADYARYKFGVNNAAANWSLPAYKSTQNYDNAYRVTARFLLWIEEKVKPGVVRTLDFQLRTHSFTNNSWKQMTGKDLDELWKAYAEKPEV
ncbi:MAG: secretory protein [Bacteroidetes bacterium]|nr:secretory protein [Bacteroidota bacterium]